MNQKQAIEATTWLAKSNEITTQLNAHRLSCKHWSLTNRRETEHHEPQFPKDVLETCEWCGMTFKNGVPWK